MVKLQRFIDKIFGFFLVFILMLFMSSKKPKNPKKFLIIKLWAIGDSVVLLPLIKAIKISYKGAKIDVLTRNKTLPIFNSYNEINAVFTLEKNFFDLIFNFREYDVLFDCEPYLNTSAILGFFLGKFRIGFSDQYRSKLYHNKIKFSSKQHMVQNYLDMARSIGIKFNASRLEKLDVDKKYKKKVDLFFKRNNVSKKDLLIGITPGVAETVKSRMWFEDRFAKLADKLILELNAKVIFIDGPDNKNVVTEIIDYMTKKPLNAAGKFNLYESFFAIGKCKIFISNDTGPMHVAAAQGCKTIGLFGPNTPVLWAPYGKGNVSIYKTKLPVAIQNDKGTFIEGNRDGYMGPIKVDDVFKAVKKLI